MFRQWKLVPNVASPVSKHRRINRKHQSFKTGFLSSAYQIQCDVPIEVDVKLKPFDSLWSSLGYLFDAAGWNGREYKDCFRGLGSWKYSVYLFISPLLLFLFPEKRN